MKPNKTRIKVVTKSNGTKRFIPEHKPWLFWYEFNDFEGYSLIKHNPYGTSKYARFTNLEEAQEVIDRYLKYVEDEEQKHKDKKSSRTEYIKYP